MDKDIRRLKLEVISGRFFSARWLSESALVVIFVEVERLGNNDNCEKMFLMIKKWWFRIELSWGPSEVSWRSLSWTSLDKEESLTGLPDNFHIQQ